MSGKKLDQTPPVFAEDDVAAVRMVDPAARYKSRRAAAAAAEGREREASETSSFGACFEEGREEKERRNFSKVFLRKGGRELENGGLIFSSFPSTGAKERSSSLLLVLGRWSVGWCSKL